MTPDIGKLSDTEQTELLRLLDHNEVVEPPTIQFTVRHIGQCGEVPPRVLAPIYPEWWRGQAWWDALPIARRRELAAGRKR